MYKFLFQSTKLHKISQSLLLITIFHTQFDAFNLKKLHSCYYFSIFFTFLRLMTIDNTTITTNTQV